MRMFGAHHKLTTVNCALAVTACHVRNENVVITDHRVVQGVMEPNYVRVQAPNNIYPYLGNRSADLFCPDSSVSNYTSQGWQETNGYHGHSCDFVFT